MRLADLDPKLEGTLESGVLRFDCPLGHGHKFRVHLGPNGGAVYPREWAASGEFPDTLTLHPSIDASQDFTGTGAAPCGWHGLITNGDVSGTSASPPPRGEP